jgi:hypothetical protein
VSFTVRLLWSGLFALTALAAVVYLSRPIWSTYLWWNFPVADIEYLRSYQRKNGLRPECGRKDLAEREPPEEEIRACFRNGKYTDTVVYSAKRAGQEMAISSFSCKGSDFKAAVHYITFGGSGAIGCEYTVVPLSAEIPPFKLGERAYYPFDGLPNAAASVFINALQSAFPKRYPADVKTVEY